MPEASRSTTLTAKLAISGSASRALQPVRKAAVPIVTAPINAKKTPRSRNRRCVRSLPRNDTRKSPAMSNAISPICTSVSRSPRKKKARSAAAGISNDQMGSTTDILPRFSDSSRKSAAVRCISPVLRRSSKTLRPSSEKSAGRSRQTNGRSIRVPNPAMVVNPKAPRAAILPMEFVCTKRRVKWLNFKKALLLLRRINNTFWQAREFLQKMIRVFKTFDAWHIFGELP